MVKITVQVNEKVLVNLLQSENPIQHVLNHTTEQNVSANDRIRTYGLLRERILSAPPLAGLGYVGFLEL